MDSNINFSLPGLYTNTNMVINLIEVYTKNKDVFNEDVNINSVYGSFPCIWNGDCVLKGDFTCDDIKTAVNYLNQNNIKLRYTFTNCKLKDEMVDDYVSNRILSVTKKWQSFNNEALITSDILKKKLESKKDINIVIGHSLFEKNIDTINKLSENNIVQLDIFINNDFDLLKKLKHPENIELIVNDPCKENCPLRKKHYDNYSNLQLKEDVNEMTCIYEDYPYYHVARQRKHYISINDIREKYLPLGFNKFVISHGNMSKQYMLESYIDYLVKPEYQEGLRYEFYKTNLAVI